MSRLRRPLTDNAGNVDRIWDQAWAGKAGGDDLLTLYHLTGDGNDTAERRHCSKEHDREDWRSTLALPASDLMHTKLRHQSPADPLFETRAALMPREPSFRLGLWGEFNRLHWRGATIERNGSQKIEG